MCLLQRMREVEQRPEQHPEHQRRDRKLGPRPLLVWNSWARFGTTLQDACFGGKQGSVLEAEWLNLHQLGESLAQPDETREANGRRIRAQRETLLVVGPRLAHGVTLAFDSKQCARRGRHARTYHRVVAGLHCARLKRLRDKCVYYKRFYVVSKSVATSSDTPHLIKGFTSYHNL